MLYLFIMKVFIALGSNLSNPQQQVINALRALKNKTSLTLVKYSSLYQSKPLYDVTDKKKQPDYINAVCEVQTFLSAQYLLKILQKIEQEAGRVKTNKRWQARILDLDILLIDNLQINENNLQVPHKEILKRDFVILPLLEIRPDLEFFICNKRYKLAQLALKHRRSQNKCRMLYHPLI
jgi:2-amino-4-hydroxy-6-hydroxymethyldihydropteridine diphosphokinase